MLKTTTLSSKYRSKKKSLKVNIYKRNNQCFVKNVFVLIWISNTAFLLKFIASVVK